MLTQIAHKQILSTHVLRVLVLRYFPLNEHAHDKRTYENENEIKLN